MTVRTIIPTRPRRTAYHLAGRRNLRSPLDSFERETARIFDALLPTSFREVLSATKESERGVSFAPAIEVRDGKEAVKISVELPGVQPEDVDLQLEKDHLVIRGEKTGSEASEDESVYRCERSFGTFERAIPLGGEIDEANVKATFRNGVLEVCLPKQDPDAGVTKIKIETAKK